ncbi:MAG: amino acid ABC transporter permease [Cyanobacteria bacterium P01_A01_bin.123]
MTSPPLLALDIAFMGEIAPKLLHAAWITLQISLISVLLGIVFGLIFGSLRVMGPPWLRSPIQWFVDFVRGVPPLLHIAFIYFALPYIGVRLNEFWTGVLALTIIAVGYEIEIIRAAIESIDRGQRESALSIGMDDRMTMVEILLPQAARRMLPALTNELANVIKASSLLSVISVNELTHVGNALIFQHFVFAEVLIQVTVLYLVIVSGLTFVSAYLEARFFSIPAYGSERYGAILGDPMIR